MAAPTSEQQNALKDAMERAKQIAAKLQQSGGGVVVGGATGNLSPAENGINSGLSAEESRKRSFRENLALMNSDQPAKRQALEPSLAVDHTDPKVIAQQVANSLVQRAGLGSGGTMMVEEVHIPNKLVGLVIGRGGDMINKLQSESGAKIQVAPDPPREMEHMYPERQITITGVSDAVEKAKELIDEIRQEGKVPERLLVSSGGPGEFAVELKIAAGKVGLVIGKGGETIKMLQERAGCKMVLFQDGEYQHAHEKPLRISGDQSKVLYGKQLVEDLLVAKELETITPDKRDMQDGNGGYGEVQVPREAVGFVIGARGQSINQIQQQTGCRVQFKSRQEDGDGDYKIATVTAPTQEQVDHALAKLNEILQAHSDRRNSGSWSGGTSSSRGGGRRNQWGPGGPNGPPFGGPRGPGGWGGPQGSGPRIWGGHGPRGHTPSGFTPPQTLPPGHQHMVVHVPANRCGLVIGKGGETLKLIHNESKVNIDINREIPDNSPYRVFHLRGSDEQIDNALKIIRDKIGDQTLQAKPADDGGQSGGPPGAQSTPPNHGGWSGPAQNQQWGTPTNQSWSTPSSGSWGQPAQDQWNQAGNWSQQGGWSQQAGQPQWDPQTQQWQQPSQQWGQQQWGQGYPQSQSTQQGVSATAQGASTTADPSQAASTGASGQQQDYSAAWALYYQQQQQYYQQYAMQQGQPTTTSVDASQTADTSASGGAQSQAMAEYQAKVAEYYKSYGQQQQAP